jgi:hypothetical protein
LREIGLPDVLGVGQHGGDEGLVLALRLQGFAGFGLRLRGARSVAHQAQHRHRVDAKQPGGQQGQHDAPDANPSPAHSRPTAATTA